MASTGAMRKAMADNPKEFDQRKIFAAPIKAMKENCKARFEAVGTAGNASKIKAINLEQMAKRYEKGELEPRVN